MLRTLAKSPNPAPVKLADVNPPNFTHGADALRARRNHGTEQRSRTENSRTVPVRWRPFSDAAETAEHEARRAADRVMQDPCFEATDIGLAESGIPSGEVTQPLQREAAAAPLAEAQGPTTESSRAPEVVERALRSHGQELDGPTREFMEPRFGQDFGGVRIHTGPQADESARAVNALAYTVGRDIVFAAGAFQPGTPSGKRLLAHELAHVRQQERSGAVPLVQRYEGPEHQDFGDRYLRELLAFLQTEDGERWARKLGLVRDDLVAQILADPLQRGGKISLGARLNPQTKRSEKPELTAGEVISLMGDMYGSVDQLASAPAQELEGLLGVMRDERAGTAPDAGKRYEEISGGRYLELAKRNDAHFARRNRAEWRRLHGEAISEARTAGRTQSKEGFQRALLLDAAAGHFLTDAYASGHLFDKSELLAAITLHLANRPVVTRNPGLQTYVGAIALAGRLPQLVLKNVHDRMNREGFEVTNAAGMRWRTFGDDSLKRAPETQRIGALAVFLSRQQIIAARGGEQPNPDHVERLMPDDDTVKRATLQAISYIPAAASEVEDLIYRNRSLAPSQFGGILGSIVESNLTTIGNPGREREISGMLDSARRTGSGPVVAPSFTLYSF